MQQFDKNLYPFFDSSSDPESDGDFETIKSILNARKAVNMNLVLMKQYEIFQERESRNCIKKYLEEVIPSYSEEEFWRHFRISKSLYNKLTVRFGESEIFARQRTDKRLSEKLYLAVFLWFAGHEACSYRDIADRFDLSLGTVYNTIHRVSFYMSSLSPSIVKWPDEHKKINSSKYFGEKCGFNKAIGKKYLKLYLDEF